MTVVMEHCDDKAWSIVMTGSWSIEMKGSWSIAMTGVMENCDVMAMGIG